jgi:hypothetical protein
MGSCCWFISVVCATSAIAKNRDSVRMSIFFIYFDDKKELIEN